MDKATHSHLIKGYIITICGGLGWAIGGACGQILFRDCGVDADWLVPIRMFLAGLMVLAIAKLCGKPIGAVWRDKASIFPLLVFALIARQCANTAITRRFSTPMSRLQRS